MSIMEPDTPPVRKAAGDPGELARRLLAIGTNRLELLRVELQEERALMLRAVFLGFCAAAFGLLAAIAFTALAVILFYDKAPAAVLLGLTLVYGAAAFLLYRRLIGLLRSWQGLSATFDQLRKDRACLKTLFN